MNSSLRFDSTSMASVREAFPIRQQIEWQGPFRELDGLRSAIGVMATASLLVLTLAAILVAFGPGRNGWNQHEPALLAAVTATPASPEAANGKVTVVEQINFGGVDYLPPAATSVEFSRIEIAPGATVSTLADAPSHSLYVIEAGAIDALFEADVQITEDGKLHGVLFGGEGEQRRMEAGEGFVMESTFAGELRNVGTEPATIAIIKIVHSAASQATDSETIPLP